MMWAQVLRQVVRADRQRVDAVHGGDRDVEHLARRRVVQHPALAVAMDIKGELFAEIRSAIPAYAAVAQKSYYVAAVTAPVCRQNPLHDDARTRGGKSLSRRQRAAFAVGLIDHIASEPIVGPKNEAAPGRRQGQRRALLRLRRSVFGWALHSYCQAKPQRFFHACIRRTTCHGAPNSSPF